MNIGELNLPARWATVPHFKTTYAQTNRAADLLAKHAPDAAEFSCADAKELCRLLSEALCAARAVDNILAGNPVPKRGDA